LDESRVSLHVLTLLDLLLNLLSLEYVSDSYVSLSLIGSRLLTNIRCESMTLWPVHHHLGCKEIGVLRPSML
jgi:hypothetical protein